MNQPFQGCCVENVSHLVGLGQKKANVSGRELFEYEKSLLDKAIKHNLWAIQGLGW